ncbi:MAG: adenylate kinase family protein [Candidatus Methanodesulfokora sp.]
MIIVVTGSVGSGKTTLSQALADILQCKYINLGEYLVSKGLVVGKDRRRGSIIVREGDIDELLDGCLIIETIYPDLLSGINPDLVLVLKCDPEELYRRLKDRYSAKDIVENIEADVIDAFTIEAINAFGENRIMEIDTTNIKLEDELKLVLNALQGSIKLPVFLNRGIDIYIKLNNIRRKLSEGTTSL